MQNQTEVVAAWVWSERKIGLSAPHSLSTSRECQQWLPALWQEQTAVMDATEAKVELVSP